MASSRPWWKPEQPIAQPDPRSVLCHDVGDDTFAWRRDRDQQWSDLQNPQHLSSRYAVARSDQRRLVQRGGAQEDAEARRRHRNGFILDYRFVAVSSRRDLGL